MQQTYKIDGMTCNGCRTSVASKLAAIENVETVNVDLAKGEAEITLHKPVDIRILQNALPEKFTLSEKKTEQKTETFVGPPEPQKSKFQQLKPLFLILLYISAASILLHRDNLNLSSVMLDFMGLFYIVFGFFKMLDLQGFPDSFRMYDPLAKRVPFYAEIYPFLETALGLMLLFRLHIQIALVLTILILGITTIGVAKTLLDKKSIRCACLGTALKLPMTEATLIENAIMLIMAVAMLLTLS